MGTVYLLGHPVAHSLSPAMHNAAFAALGLPHHYQTRDVEPDRLEDFVDALRRDDVLGANVTIPHKERVLRYMDEAGEDARRVSAVNTIVRRGPRLIGENTDVYGFERAIGESAPAGEMFRGGTVLVLGAGGAARACAVVLLRRGNEVRIASRTRVRAEQLVAGIEVDGRRATAVRWPTSADVAAVDGVVNATPLGLHGEDPLAGMPIHERLRVVDLVPTAAMTPLVKRARAVENVVVVDGLSMLLHQAARSFALWTGRDAPLAVMRSALPRAV
ncbi:MAG TPA: shikimate dehydrogenase [Candidatus Limnocylindria bacterium]|nr:shikimate dehydrogenase [Candidatus Limnocylindria bacterium]